MSSILKKRQLQQVVLLCSMIVMTGVVNSSELRLKSQPEQIAVIELFTSHGCSSCPPADAWLKRFSTHKDLWKKVIPMAFHVDYWDYLGWKDKFASAEYSDRQRDYRKSGRTRAVYTPGFVVGGKEWSGFFRGRIPDLSTGNQVGTLEARIVPSKKAMARFTPATQDGGKNLKAHMAVLGFGISTQIGGGENSGHTLTEDFVVLGDVSTPANSELKWTMPWPTLKDDSVYKKAVVVWLSREGDPSPIQAVGGWLN